MNRHASLWSIVGVCCFLAISRDGALAQFSPPAGGWDYSYEADSGEDEAGTGGFTALDGTWSHDNGSDQWDGEGFGEGRPGGVELLEDSYLRLQDTGDPRDHGFSDPGSNRKQYLGHNISVDGASASVLDDGATLNFRIRVPTDGPLDELHPDGGGGVLEYPDFGDGYGLHNGAKANIGIKQANGGLIGFSLVNDADGGGVFETGLLMNDQNLLELDIEEWHEFWVTIEASGGAGTHEVILYLDGDPEPLDTFEVTSGGGSDFDGFSYIAIGLGRTSYSGALDVDFFRFAAELVEPTGPVGPESPLFHRGDADSDGGINVTDGVFILNFLFSGGATPSCRESADADDDGSINVTDGVFVLNFLFSGGAEPLPPGPPGMPCGPDPDGSPDLGCDAYDGC